MKIVDSFLFSEVYEKDLLLLKFVLEDEGVDEWVILENAYTFQGGYKGLQAKLLLQTDTRFAKYLPKITVIEREEVTPTLDKTAASQNKAFEVEFWQRNLALPYFIDKYDDNDWVIISDVDEAIDFTDSERKKELIARLKLPGSSALSVSLKKYWFDFDNTSSNQYALPMCTKKYLLKTGLRLQDVRVQYRRNIKDKWKNVIAFEYSSCVGVADLMRKYNSFAHTGFTENYLQQALRCNHRPITKERQGELKNYKRFFFYKIPLTTANSPKYVRDNITSLKTNNINADYKANRLKDYPHLFEPLAFLKNNVLSFIVGLKRKFAGLYFKLKPTRQ